MSAASSCPSDRELAALLEDGSEAPESIESHIAECDVCQKRLEKLSASASVVSDFIAVIEPPGPELESTPELRSAMENAKTGGFEFASASGNSGRNAPLDLEFLAPSEYPDSLGKLGNFEIRELIAEGGMGLVFRAHDGELQRDVAIKVLSPQLAADPGAREMFLSEARAAASLDHENILPIHLVETSRAIPFLVMPLVRGGNLHDRLQSGKPLVFESEILPIALASARALAAAHASGLIHRDVKPANLMLETAEDGTRRIWLADFGLARAIQESGDSGSAKPKTIAGTPHFLAPELIAGQPANESSDLFALGAVFYAMAAGRLPFSGKTTSEVLKAARETDPEPADRVNPMTPKWFGDLIRQLLAKDPARRFSSADELVARLEQHVEDSRAAEFREPLFRIVRRLAAALLAMIALAAAVIAGSDLTGRTSLVNATLARATGNPFGIRGRWGTFSALPKAIEKAPANAAVEIFHDGLLAIPMISIDGKPLTLEAGRGFLPTLVNEEPNRSLINIREGALTLRNLTLQQNNTPGLAVRPMIKVRRAPLVVEQFAFVRLVSLKVSRTPSGVRRPAFVELEDCPSAIFRDGLVQGRLSTFLLAVTEEALPAREIHLENCVTTGSQLATIRVNRTGPAPLDLKLDRCTGFHRVPFLVTRHSGPVPVTIELNNSALDANEALLWTPARRFPILSNALQLRGTGNLIGVTGARFINLNSLNVGSATLTEGTPTDLADFLRLWNLPEDFARQTDRLLTRESVQQLTSGNLMSLDEIQFHESSGMPAADMGADFSKVGPVR